MPWSANALVKMGWGPLLLRLSDVRSTSRSVGDAGGPLAAFVSLSPQYARPQSVAPTLFCRDVQVPSRRFGDCGETVLTHVSHNAQVPMRSTLGSVVAASAGTSGKSGKAGRPEDVLEVYGRSDVEENTKQERERERRN